MSNLLPSVFGYNTLILIIAHSSFRWNRTVESTAALTMFAHVGNAGGDCWRPVSDVERSAEPSTVRRRKAPPESRVPWICTRPGLRPAPLAPRHHRQPRRRVDHP